MKLIIISGRSGSGKSICLHVLEDMGFYCIDNLPVGLLPALVTSINQQHPFVAISIDARNLPEELNRFETIFKQLKQTTDTYQIVFLDADDTTLLKRFNETRRKHPLTTDTISLKEALKRERNLLQPIAELADLRIDTSRLSMHQLWDLINKRIAKTTKSGLSLLFQSFGYKYGVPVDADYVFDVRCLPNPYWQPELRPYNGLDPIIGEFLQAQTSTQLLLDDLIKFLEKWIKSFEADSRNYMTIAIGCTGGQHRSVYIAKELAQYFSQNRPHVQLRHRELS